jgi:polysaccharide export outer membrane protein
VRCAPAALLGIACGLTAGMMAGCARTPLPAPPPAEQASALREDYRIGPADVLGIRVWRNPELSIDVPVRPDGRISVPLLGDIEAAGRTTAELRDVIAEQLTEYVAAPDVTVIVVAINSKQVYLVGEVLRPAALGLTVDMRVLDAIAAVGGFSPFANKRNVRILRRQPDGSVVEYRFNYNAFLRGSEPGSNIQLLPGDTIVVPD